MYQTAFSRLPVQGSNRQLLTINDEEKPIHVTNYGLLVSYNHDIMLTSITVDPYISQTIRNRTKKRHTH